MTFLKVPLHKVHLTSDLVTGDVIVGVRSSLPVPGVSFILGNDLARGNVWGTSKSVPSAVVVSTPMSADVPDECGKRFPHVFVSCAVTRARGKQLKADRPCEGEFDLHPDSEVTVEKSLLVHSEDAVDRGSFVPSNQIDGGTVKEPLGMTLEDNTISESSDLFTEYFSLGRKKYQLIFYPLFFMSLERT